MKIDGNIREGLHVGTNQLRVWILDDERVRLKKKKRNIVLLFSY